MQVAQLSSVVVSCMIKKIACYRDKTLFIEIVEMIQVQNVCISETYGNIFPLDKQNLY